MRILRILVETGIFMILGFGSSCNQLVIHNEVHLWLALVSVELQLQKMEINSLTKVFFFI